MQSDMGGLMDLAVTHSDRIPLKKIWNKEIHIYKKNKWRAALFT